MTEITEQLTKYLTDAHSIEEQALAQLRTAPEIAGDPELSGAYREHLRETEGHERLVRELLEARGAKPSLSSCGSTSPTRTRSTSRRSRCSSADRSSPAARRSRASTRSTSTRPATTRRRSKSG